MITDGYVRAAMRSMLVNNGIVPQSMFQFENSTPPNVLPYVRETYISGQSVASTQILREEVAIVEYDIFSQANTGDNASIVLAQDIVDYFEQNRTIATGVSGMTANYDTHNLSGGNIDGDYYILPLLLYVNVTWER